MQIGQISPDKIYPDLGLVIYVTGYGDQYGDQVFVFRLLLLSPLG